MIRTFFEILAFLFLATLALAAFYGVFLIFAYLPKYLAVNINGFWWLLLTSAFIVVLYKVATNCKKTK